MMRRIAEALLHPLVINRNPMPTTKPKKSPKKKPKKRPKKKPKKKLPTRLPKILLTKINNQQQTKRMPTRAIQKIKRAIRENKIACGRESMKSH